MFCKLCGAVADPRKKTPGSIWIELILWWFFLIPGIIYSIWRRTGRKKICSSCGSDQLIPTDSPIARQLQRQSY